ncbi:acyl-CoA desaturase [Modestobacter sp. VKM Ac-2977]|uniref:fatty acid desaturase family protein n=1 Tax=Modestobacter sp. VKM Ac-2977 TaxID=3004131 RepID=UPI0022AB449A|nr:acyl-CoA desaturase [Modestobacter sp. VKM Ac-2977]MCZ2821652.1 acyl-CoA desaturase [Modestobacter sp. VKM Ac-2977]
MTATTLEGSTPPPARAPRPERARDRQVSVYAELSQQVKDAGLLNRRRPYYVASIALTVAAFAGVWVAIVALGDSWWQLGLAVVLSLVCTQFGFLGHDTAHRQAFGSHRANEWNARVLSCGFAGIGYGWWMQKHNRHHNAPNQMGKDPDIESAVLAFTPDDAEDRMSGLRGWWTRHQGWAFFPLLCFEGAALHANSLATLAREKTMPHRRLEIAIIAARLGLFVGAVFLIMPPLLAVAFILVQQAVFGLLLGGSFAPNHKGMPIVPKNAKVDFLRRQVLMSRNIKGGRVTDFMMGGLNYQIEHHLFPSMPRPNLKKVQPMVRAHCAQHGISYTETSLVGSYRIVVQYLNRVGLGERDPFVCPLTSSIRN